MVNGVRSSSPIPPASFRRHGCPHRCRRAAGAAFLFLLPLLTAPLEPGAQGEPRAWRLLESSPQRIAIDVTVAEPVWLEEDDGTGRLSVPGFPGIAWEAGRPLPALDLPVAVPPEVEVEVRATLTGVHPIGHDLIQLLSADEPSASEPPGTVVDEAGHVRYQRPCWAATQRLLRLRVQPVRPDAQGRLLAPTGIRITIEMRAALGTEAAASWGRIVPARPTGSDDAWGVAFDRLLVNPSDARLWRRGVEAVTPSRQQDSFSSATAPWVRIEIDRRGLYVITGNDLEALGLTPALIDLSRLRLFTAGPEELPESLLVEEAPAWMDPVALYVQDDGDGLWDDATRIYFLGQGPDGWRDDLGLAPMAADAYYVHPYSQARHYWLTWGGSFSTEPLWVEEREALPEGLPLRTRARARIHFEKNQLYDARPRLSAKIWERFFWLDLTGLPSVIDLTVPGPATGGRLALRVAAWGKNTRYDAWPDPHHVLIVRADGDSLGTIAWDRYDRGIFSDTVSVGSERLRIGLEIPERRNGFGEILRDGSYLAWIEAEYDRSLQLESDSLAFMVRADTAAAFDYRIAGLDRDDGWGLFDVSAMRAPVRLLPQITEAGSGYAADIHVTPEDETARLVFLQMDDAARPARIALPEWDTPMLRERVEAVDYLIVAPRAFWTAAQKLASHRRSYFFGARGDSAQTGRVAVVDIQQVFDEFSGGQHDPTALRNFLRLAYLNWKGESSAPTFSHLMLLGNAHYDPRDYLGLEGEDLIPSYLYYNDRYTTDPTWRPEHIADDWLATLDGPADEALDLALGRLPVLEAGEAEDLVDKLIRYDVEPPSGAWRSKLLLAADDICQSLGPDALGWLHLAQVQRLVTDYVPPDARLVKLYLVEYGMECIYDRKPDAARDLLDHFADGVLWFNFTGHGSETQLADERLLETASLGSLENGEKLFFFFTASCAVGKFAHGGDGVGVAAVRMPQGGAVGVISASGLASATSNAQLNQDFFAAVFPERTLHKPVALGPALWASKVDLYNYNDLRYNLLGDPATRLATPKLTVDLTLEQDSTGATTDTLYRGMRTRLRGEIQDCLGNPVPSYTGTVDLHVYDSDQLRRPTIDPIHDYTLPGARIYEGTFGVEGGAFTTEFFMPTALLSGERGPARVYAYGVREDGSALDAYGALQALRILESGGPLTDTEPPEIRLAWEEPAAEPQARSRVTVTLSDSSGIYVAALSPSRAVVISIVDEDGRFLVADDVSAALTFPSDYTEGTLSYALPEGLPSGQPLTLVCEASDNVMNRQRGELAFELTGAAGGRLLDQVYAMPNPMDAETHFLLEMSRSADVEITLYTVTGRVVRQLSATGVTRERGRRIGIPFDGRDEEGDDLANGVYFYRVVVRDGGGGQDERIERLVVFRESGR